MSNAEAQDDKQPHKQEPGPTASCNSLVLGPGSRIGQFRIERELGRGGMGVVYLAHDTKLDRSVAIKSLPAQVLGDRQVLSRWEREARLLASLNHPNIATIHEVHEAPKSASYLVLEYIPGQTLADRLKAGPMPLDEALSVFEQITEALEAAHQAGIIHRDLKPANIKITDEARVKLLDFGIAKELGKQISYQDSTITQPGKIIGTPAYMSPEQTRGQPADRRTDIWAFGCCLYESLTGKCAFTGETDSDVLAKVLEREPNWDALPQKTPMRIHRLLRRCLEKNPRRRLRDIGEAWFEINETQSGTSEAFALPSDAAAASRVSRRHITLIGLVCLLVGVLIASALFKSFTRSTPPVPPTISRLSVNLPADKRIFFGLDSPSCYVAISPDGTRLVYTGGVDTRSIQLYTRAMNALKVEAIPGTEEARNPFFSPDGQWVGFFTVKGELKKVSLAGGQPLTLLEDLRWGRALFGSWGKDGNIVFAGDSGLRQIPAEGGAPEVLIAPNAGKGTVLAPDVGEGTAWPLYPQILPGGNAILHTFGGHADVLVPGTEERKTVLENAIWARYMSSGHLIFLRNQVLMAAPFDLERLEVTGSATPVIERIRMDSARLVPQMAVSDNGTLLCAPVTSKLGKSTLVWVDRQGQTEALDNIPRNYGPGRLRLSPNGRQVATQVIDKGSESQVHVFDISRRMLTQLTTEGTNIHPEWSPDGKQITFLSQRDAGQGLYFKAVDESAPAEFLTLGDFFPCSWSPDGKSLACMRQDPNTQDDIWIVRLDNDSRPQPFLETSSLEDNPRFSPDSRWLAYASSESGEDEVYIQRYAKGGRKIQVSTEGGTCPVWASDGSELFYSDGVNMMVAPITPDPNFTVGTPEPLFKVTAFEIAANLGPSYDISPDGQRFVVLKRSELPEVQLTVVQNWFEELRRLVPSGKSQ